MSRSAYALCAATLLFFILYTAPHRVHHFFDQVQSASHEGSGDHHSEQPNKSGAEPDCVFQLSASRCALRVTAPIQALALTRLVQELFFSNDSQRPISFSTATFHIRAPPNS